MNNTNFGDRRDHLVNNYFGIGVDWALFNSSDSWGTVYHHSKLSPSEVNSLTTSGQWAAEASSTTVSSGQGSDRGRKFDTGREDDKKDSYFYIYDISMVFDDSDVSCQACSCPQPDTKGHCSKYLGPTSLALS